MDEFGFIAESILTTPELMATVIINGVTVTGAVMRAEESRVHQFLDDTEWKYPAYEVFLPVDVLAAPCSIREQDEIYLPIVGMKAAIRSLDVPVGASVPFYVYLLVVCIPR